MRSTFELSKTREDAEGAGHPKLTPEYAVRCGEFGRWGPPSIFIVESKR
ncbi:MAG: hypothetical protein IPK13_03755 [Deltaproteobacteria bacterium]|nr:hypothetical protein [Deltaproteobacteria bacterium]